MYDDMYDDEDDHRTIARSSPRRRQDEDTGTQVFRKLILHWRIENIERMDLELRPLPRALSCDDDRSGNHRRYYQNFLPLILEETRAILAQGLEAEKRHKTNPFQVLIIHCNPAGRNRYNPFNLQLRGKLPENTDEGRAGIVLKLTYRGAFHRSTSILCLADIREDNMIMAKVILETQDDLYGDFIDGFNEQNPTAFDGGSKWTACVLGSVLPQMRMYEACYDPKEPVFMRDVITGQLQPPRPNIISPFPDLTLSQQQVVKAFCTLSPDNQAAIAGFFKACFSSQTFQTLMLRYFSLPISKQQLIQYFLSLTSSEQAFVRAFHLLNVVEQTSAKAFFMLDSTKQPIIKSFAKLIPLERNAVQTFSESSFPNKTAIQYCSALNRSEQQTVKDFSLLTDLEWETVSAFYRLTASEREAIEKFYHLNKTLHDALQEDSASYISYAWKFLTKKSWYESKINPLKESINIVKSGFSSLQQHAVELFDQLSPIRQQIISVYCFPLSLDQTAVQAFLKFDHLQKEAIKVFYGLAEASQEAIKRFHSLSVSEQDDIESFYRLSGAVQEVIQKFYAWSEGPSRESVHALLQLNEAEQSVVKDFFVLADDDTIQSMHAFHQLPPATQENIRRFSSLDATHSKAILDYFSLTPSERDSYHESYVLNPSQRTAVRDFYGLTQGIQLVQGPPGTGKTTMIVALLHFLCAQEKRILVCAPSNKAVQIIAERFFEQYPFHHSALIGVEQKLKSTLRPIFIHTWAEDICSAIDAVIANMEPVIYQKKSISRRQLLQPIQQIISTIDCATQSFDDSLDALERSINRSGLKVIVQQLTYLRDKICDENECHSGQPSSNLERELLNCAEVIFSTLSTAGRKVFEDIDRPDILIIDEASQAVEAETLIPFALQPEKCLLVGDIQQLPATVVSQEAVRYNYDWSMMWRLTEECKQRCNMLTKQYRMHPAIRQWPSEQYYNNQLEDAPEIAHRPVSLSQYGPYAFIDLASEERSANHSFYNPEECRQVITLLHELAAKSVDIKTQVDIITFYAAQAEYMQREFSKIPLLRGVKINTVDSYQGSENDYIIISFVRANRKRGVGFLRDFRRLNVALTRARLALLMVGNAATLERDRRQDVARLVRDARARRCLFGGMESTSIAPTQITVAESLVIGFWHARCDGHNPAFFGARRAERGTAEADLQQHEAEQHDGKHTPSARVTPTPQ